MLALLPWTRPTARAEPLPLACPGAWRPIDSGCVRQPALTVSRGTVGPGLLVPCVPLALGSSLRVPREVRARAGSCVPSPTYALHALRSAHGAAPRQPTGEQLADGRAKPERRAAAVRGRARACVRAAPRLPARQAGRGAARRDPAALAARAAAHARGVAARPTYTVRK